MFFCFRDVRYGRCFCLRFETLKRKSCVSSPPQKVLNEMAREMIRNNLQSLRERQDPPLTEDDQTTLSKWSKLLEHLLRAEADSGKSFFLSSGLA